MAIKALMVDFYGTLVREEDGVIKDVCRELADSSPQILFLADTARALWQACHDRYLNWYGGQYRPVAELEADALREVAEQFQCRADVADLTGQLAAANRAPEAYADGRLFCASLPLPVCLLSNGDRPVMEKIVTYTQLNLPEMVFSGDVRSCKPRREIFEEALSRLGVKAEEALYIGDSLTYDVAPAAALGINTVWVNRGRRPLSGDIQPDMVVSDLAEIRRLIR